MEVEKAVKVVKVVKLRCSAGDAIATVYACRADIISYHLHTSASLRVVEVWGSVRALFNYTKQPGYCMRTTESSIAP